MDSGVTADVLSRRMACPRKGDVLVVKRAIRHLRGRTGVSRCSSGDKTLQVHFLPCPTQIGRETKKLDMARVVSL